MLFPLFDNTYGDVGRGGQTYGTGEVQSQSHAILGHLPYH